MALPNSAITFSIAPGTKIAKLTQDNASGVTYDTALTIKLGTISFDDNYFSEQLRFDGKVGDRYTEFDTITGSFELSENDLAALAMITGNTVTTTGTTTTEVKTLNYDADVTPPYFAIGFKPKYTPDSTVGDLHFYLHKCKITGMSGGGGDRAYNTRTIEFEAIPRVYDSITKSEVMNATAAAIAFTSLSPST